MLKSKFTVLRKKKKAGQCYRCQNFFYIAKFCHIEDRCVACGETHTSDTGRWQSFPANKAKIAPVCCNFPEEHPVTLKPTKSIIKICFQEVLC